LAGCWAPADPKTEKAEYRARSKAELAEYLALASTEEYQVPASVERLQVVARQLKPFVDAVSAKKRQEGHRKVAEC